MLTEEHRVVAFAHVSNVLGSRARCKARGGNRSHPKARCSCSTAARRFRACRSTSPSIGCDFYAFSGHKLYGPTGIGCLWGRSDLLAGDAAVAGRRVDDRPGDLRRKHVPRSARAVRGRHSAHRRSDRPPRRHRLGRRARHGRDPRPRMRPRRRDRATHFRISPASPSTAPPTAPGSSASTSTGFTRTTPPPYWTMRASRSAPATIARSR